MGEPTKVLVVDDDVVSRMVLMHLVATSGNFDIFEAEDGEDAWRQLDAGLRPAITFCDLRMPGMSGMELLARVRQDQRMAHIPFVIVSAAAEHELAGRADGLRVHGYLVKPFDPDQVRALLAALPGNGAEEEEAPAATARRLGIDAPRLLLYLGGLHKQLVASSAEIEQMIACADVEGARACIAQLRQGCQTLGLFAAAAALAQLEAGAPASLVPCRVEEVLAGARQAAVRQSESARMLVSAN